MKKRIFIKPSVKTMKIDDEALMTTSVIMSNKNADPLYPKGGDAKAAMPDYSFDI